MEYLTFRETGEPESLWHVREAHGSKAFMQSTRHITNGNAGDLGRRGTEDGRAPKESPPALRAAAGFDGYLAHALGMGGTRAAGLIETPGRRLLAVVGPTGVGETTTLAKLAERAVVSVNGACA